MKYIAPFVLLVAACSGSSASLPAENSSLHDGIEDGGVDAGRTNDAGHWSADSALPVNDAADAAPTADDAAGLYTTCTADCAQNCESTYGSCTDGSAADNAACLRARGICTATCDNGCGEP